MLPGSVSYICLFSFQSILGRFFWNFITGPSIFPLPLLAPRQRNFDRSLQIPRQPSQLEGTKYPKLNSWICRPNSHVALFTIRSELRTPTYMYSTYMQQRMRREPSLFAGLHVWEIELAPADRLWLASLLDLW